MFEGLSSVSKLGYAAASHVGGAGIIASTKIMSLSLSNLSIGCKKVSKVADVATKSAAVAVGIALISEQVPLCAGNTCYRANVQEVIPVVQPILYGLALTIIADRAAKLTAFLSGKIGSYSDLSAHKVEALVDVATG